MVRLALIVSLAVTLLAACGQPDPRRESLRVAVAVSLRPALEEIAAAFAQGRPGVEVLINAGASGMLRHQIEHGDAADVFISADERHMRALVERGLVAEDAVRVLTTNRLVVAAPARRRVTINALRDLASPEFARVSIGAPATAPVGAYAEAALRAAGVWDVLQGRLVFAQSAAQVAAHLRAGEVDAGLLYATDVLPLGETVQVLLAVDPALHPRIGYFIAPLRSSPVSDLAQAFVAFALGPTGAEVLARHGFGAGGA